MNRLLCYGILIPVVFALTAAGCGKSEKSSQKPAKKETITIAVIPKGTIHEFWKTIHAGALDAARDTGVEIIWKGPLREDDREEQLQIVETFISSGVSAIVIAPLDDRSLIKPVAEAQRLGIPTIVIDSDLQGDFHAAFVATDNYRGGVLAAERVGELLNGAGKIIVLRYQEGSASNTNREEGFLDTMRSKFPSIEILSDNQYAGVTTESAYRLSENLLNRFKEVDAIFAPNEPVTFGCLRALQARGLAHTIKLVGFDASEKLTEALGKGEIEGLVLQDPFKIGSVGVRTAVAVLRGEKVEKRIDTGVVLATPANMNEPEINTLLHPVTVQ
ncbi:substrate-binding domain-containing protein [bacterium]|nr:substrate-binding domain-containing protein [bacterium]